MKSFNFNIRAGSIGDFQTEHWTEEDWVKHKEYIEQLKASGEYGKEHKASIEITECPALDNVNNASPLTSCDFIVLDFTNKPHQ